jgi:hypothetical protein
MASSKWLPSSSRDESLEGRNLLDLQRSSLEQRLATMNLKKLVWIAIALALASVAPLIFPAAQAGYGNLESFALWFLLPAIGVLVVLSLALWRRDSSLGRAIVLGAAAGALATVALEIVREIGFHMGYMPGDLPELMGVLLLNRFALGPSVASNIAGWAYHFWNGASFGIIYTLIFGTRRRWVAVAYGLAVGTGFMLSPVVATMGVGFFGLQFSIGFPVTVYLAHLAFGASLGFLAQRFLSAQPSTLIRALFATAHAS